MKKIAFLAALLFATLAAPPAFATAQLDVCVANLPTGHPPMFACTEEALAGVPVINISQQMLWLFPHEPDAPSIDLAFAEESIVGISPPPGQTWSVDSVLSWNGGSVTKAVPCSEAGGPNDCRLSADLVLPSADWPDAGQGAREYSVSISIEDQNGNTVLSGHGNFYLFRPVPEPGTLFLLASGLLALPFVRRT